MRLRISAADVDGRTRLLELPDGRRLAYCEWGEPTGEPVVHCHGMPGSRLELHAPEEVYRKLGIRLITIDRPGYGLSDPSPERTLLDWPADVEALADTLGLDRFGMMGLSGGGPFALSCAHRLGTRLTGVAVAGSLGPLDRPGALAEMKALNRLGLWSARHLPWALDRAYRLLRFVLKRSPERFVLAFANDKPRADRELIADPGVLETIEGMLLEAVRNGVLGAVQEVALLAGPWGFQPSEISVPVSLWHGDRDDTAPLLHGLTLAREIPGARLQVCPGEGHMVLWTHLPEVLAAATGRPLPSLLAA